MPINQPRLASPFNHPGTSFVLIATRYATSATRRANLLLAVMVFCPAVLFAQFQLDPSEEVGIKAYGSYQAGNLDSVNMMNGNLSVRIPLYSLPQRGSLGMSFSVVLDDSGYGRTKNGSNLTGEIDETYYRNSPIGAQLVWDQDIWPNQFYTTAKLGSQTTFSYYTYEGFQVVSGDFTRHQMFYDSNTPTQLRSGDSSEYLFKPLAPNPTSPTGWAESDATYSPQSTFSYRNLQYVAPGTLYTPNGISYSFAGYPNTSETVKDPDGNTISVSATTGSSFTPWQSGNATITDTMSRTIPSLPAMTSSTSGCPDLSTIAPNQPLVGSKTWNVPGPNGSASTYIFCYVTVTVKTGFNFDDGYGAGFFSTNTTAIFNNEFISTTPLLQSVVLPNQTYYGFVYDSAPVGNTTTVAYGDLLKLILPTGGIISYAYGNLNDMSSSGPAHQTRYVASRTIQADTNSPSYSWNYTINSATAPYIHWGYPYTSTVQDPNGNHTTYSYTWFNSPNGNVSGAFYETNRQTYQGTVAPSHLLQSIQTAYNTYSIPYSYPFNGTALVIPRVVTTTNSTGLISTTTYGYDGGFLPENLICQSSTGASWTSSACTADSATANYPFGKVTSLVTTGFDGGTIKQELTPYYFQSHSSYLASNFLNLPASDTIENGSSAILSSETYSYDESGYVASATYPLGHLTTTSKWVSGSIYAATHSWWNANGTVSKSIDPNQSCITNYTYSSTYQSAYPTTITNCLNQSTIYTYDFNTGQKVSVQDPNLATISYTYSDSMGRITNVAYPDGGATQYTYNDTASPVNLQVQEKLNSSTWKVVEMDVDGFGRQISQKLTDPSSSTGIIEQDASYDGLGRLASMTNPYDTTSDSSYGITSFLYDALGRKTTTCQPDNTTVAAETCTAQGSYQSWNYAGNVVTFRDELANQWQRTTDALGRLTKVLEPNGTTTSPSLETDYTYDALSNLLSVRQIGVSGTETPRARTFNYDGLSRLNCSSNSEISTSSSAICAPAVNSPYVDGTVGYAYDLNGNLVSKTAPVTNAASGTETMLYCYDKLNRLTFKYLSPGTYLCSSPQTLGASAFAYDGNLLPGSVATVPGFQNAIGRLTDAQQWIGSTMVSERVPYVFDKMGRPQWEVQIPFVTGGAASYTVRSAYDLSGDLTGTLNSATNIVINYGYDSVARLNSVTSSLSSSGTTTYPTTLYAVNTYGPAGVVQATYAGEPNTTGFFNLFRYYDRRMRLLDNELYPASGVAFGTGTVTLTGGNATDSGSVTVKAGNVTASGNYSIGDSADAVAGVLAASFNQNSTSAVTATVLSGTYSASDSTGQVVCANGMVPNTTTPCAVLYLKAIVLGIYGDVALSFPAGTGTSFTPTPSNSTLIGGVSSPQGAGHAYVYTLGYAKNGNIVGVNDAYNGSWTYKYDTLNRLAAASLTAYEGTGVVTPTGTFNCEFWTYDSFGNRLSESETGTGTPTTCPSSPPIQTHWATYQSSNRISNSDTGGASYDNAGNVTQDALNKYIYDDEGRVCAVQNILTTSATQYIYGADGQRVAKGKISNWPGSGSKCAPPTTANGFTLTTTFLLSSGGAVDTEIDQPTSASPTGSWHKNVYAGGQLLATYTGQNGSAPALYFSINDWLGTKRLELNTAGQASAYWKSDPFGDYLSQVGSGVDATEQHFTGKERDSESGLDYFSARYFGSSMGRMMSPDPIGGDLIDPQSLNKYAYVLNNPLRNIDPTGLYMCRAGQDCSAFEKALAALRGSKNADVARAAAAYGAAGENNGVTVGFADLTKKGENGNTVSTIEADPNGPAGSVRAHSDVTINSKISGDDLSATVGHEGSHAADAKDVVASGLTPDGEAIHAGMNITPYQSEQRAFGVTNAILSSENQSRKFDCGLSACTLGKGAVMGSQLPGVIDQILAHDSVYNQGGKPMSSTNQGPSVVNAITPTPPKATVPH